jgi:hypothetical protein
MCYMCLGSNRIILYKAIWSSTRKNIIKSSNHILINSKGLDIVKCTLEAGLYKLGVTNTLKHNEIAIPTTSNIDKATLRHLCLGHINQQR